VSAGEGSRVDGSFRCSFGCALRGDLGGGGPGTGYVDVVAVVPDISILLACCNIATRLRSLIESRLVMGLLLGLHPLSVTFLRFIKAKTAGVS
jgi:hypothetical protein